MRPDSSAQPASLLGDTAGSLFGSVVLFVFIELIDLVLQLLEDFAIVTVAHFSSPIILLHQP